MALRRSLTVPLLLTAVAGVLPAADSNDYQNLATPPPTPTAPIQSPMLGVEMSPVPSPVLAKEGLTPNEGVYVQNVFGGTAASSMGVQPGDVILQVNGTAISSMSDLRNEISASAVGDPVQVVVQRNGQQVAMGSSLQAWPAEIPHEQLDPAAEQRFRQWQAERMKEQQDQADQLQDQVHQLQQQLADHHQAASGDPTAAQVAQEVASAGGAWQLAYHILPGALPATSAPHAHATGAPAAPIRCEWHLESETLR